MGGFGAMMPGWKFGQPVKKWSVFWTLHFSVGGICYEFRLFYGAKKPEISMIKSVVLEVNRLKATSGPRPTVKWRLKTLPVW